jgi:hypothetical protein
MVLDMAARSCYNARCLGRWLRRLPPISVDTVSCTWRQAVDRTLDDQAVLRPVVHDQPDSPSVVRAPARFSGAKAPTTDLEAPLRQAANEASPQTAKSDSWVEALA